MTATDGPLAPERLVPPTPGQLRRLLRAEGLWPKKSLSQHFLTDPAALDEIVAAAEIAPGDRVVEIGPGLGVLTRRLLAAGASVHCGRARPRPRRVAAARAGRCARLHAHRGGRAQPPSPRRAPATATTRSSRTSRTTSRALCSTRSSRAEAPPALVVMLVQAEVAERVAAPPGRMSYLSAFAQNVADAEVVGRVLPQAFEPPPEVDSAILRLRRRPQPIVAAGDERERFIRVVQAGFRQRRKQLHNGLGRELPVDRALLDRAMASCAVDPERRPADAELEEWACLAAALADALVTPLALSRAGQAQPLAAIVGRRGDGFHELDSIFVLVDLADRLLLMTGSPGASAHRCCRRRGAGRAGAARREPRLARSGRRTRRRAAT